MCCRPLRANLSHAPVSLLPHSAFCLGRLVSAKSCSSKPFPGQEEQLRGSRGKKGRFSGQKREVFEAKKGGFRGRLVGLETRQSLIPITDRNAAGIFMRAGRGGTKQTLEAPTKYEKLPEWERVTGGEALEGKPLNCNILNCWAWLCAINIFCEPPEWQKYDMTWKAKWLQIAGKIRRMPIWHKPLWDHHLCNLRARTKFVYYLNLKKFFTTTNGEVGIWHIDINIDIDIDTLLNTWCWWLPALDTCSLQ